jgi:GNAT superfamily N-acetyltransferase
MRHAPSSFVIRSATDADSAGLMRLVGVSCASRGVRWEIERASDFFLPFRAESGGWSVLIAEDEGSATPVGCVSLAMRDSWVAGHVLRTCYVSNLLVAPACRGRGIGDALCGHAAEAARCVVGDDGPVLLAIREGNPYMSRRISGPRGLPELRPFAQVEIHSISTARLCREAVGKNVEINRATFADLGEMAALSRRVFPERQFAPAVDADSLASWIAAAPGLAVSDYWVARRNGVVLGWLGLWDEGVVRRVRVAGYSPIRALRYTVRNAVARFTGSELAPKVGDTVGCAVVVHLCIRQDCPSILRDMLSSAARALRSRGCAWMRIALDSEDELSPSLCGLPSRTSSFGAYVASPSGSYGGPPLDDRPTHFEAALA